MSPSKAFKINSLGVILSKRLTSVLTQLLTYVVKQNTYLCYETVPYVIYQLGALDGFARSQGFRLQHVKLHGAFYNRAMGDKALAESVIKAIMDMDPGLSIMALSGSKFARLGEEMGAKIVHEVFADRAYNDDGSLVDRSLDGAVIGDEGMAIARVLKMVTEARVQTLNRKKIGIRADSICVHGDNPKALAFVKKIRQALEKEGITIRAFGRE